MGLSAQHPAIRAKSTVADFGVYSLGAQRPVGRGRFPRLKKQPGLDIVATGGIQLVHGLIAEGLVDEYRLFVYPTVVGRGARLFEEGRRSRTWSSWTAGPSPPASRS